ncbi:neuferricin [Anticarsia gemmatalis]|uniref:neuferricin n=1 Tax=Anticarsia gemmatalis TaxID=129554 RepID=UPI003F760809
MGVTQLISFKSILISVLIAIVAIVYRNEISSYFKINVGEVKDKPGVYSVEKLAQFDGVTEKNLYLAVLGIIFDVTEGKKHYEKGAGYHYFVGKDGSRALITGNFEDTSDDKDHVMDFSCNELFTLLHWRNTFTQKYIKTGVLKGRYYDGNGQETAYLKELKNKIEQCEIERQNSKKEDLKYPPCNIAWSEEEGTKVWCTTSSGGIRRNWIGVPRQLYTPGVEKPRCICLNTNDQDTSSGLIKEYANCPNTSTMCIVKN